MDGDDQLLVVVVGDEDDDENNEQLLVTHESGVTVKIEPTDEEEELPRESMGVEELLETLEKHGEVVDLDLMQILQSGNVDQIEGEEVEYIDENFWAESEEDISEGVPMRLVPRKHSRKYGDGKEVFRHKMLKPHEQKSFVKQLKKQRPELRNNEKKLINALAEIMRNTKQPELPSDHSFVNENADLQCSKCTHTSRTMMAAARHFQEMHGERYLICFACGVDFRSKTNLYKHEKRCLADDAVVVLKARALYVGRKARSRPFIPKYEQPYKKKSYYKRGELHCELCPATFSSKMSLQAHLYLHNGMRPFRCPQCPASYTSPPALSRHMVKHTSIEYICDHCKRSFKLKSALVVHMNTHKPEKRFGCDECGKRYAQKSALQLHVNRVHRCLPPPCACEICPKRFPRMSLLKAHMLKEHGMNILTRKMFLRYLPTMPEEDFVERAKLIFKEEPDDTSSEYIMQNSIYAESEAPMEQDEYLELPAQSYEGSERGTDKYELEISQLPVKVKEEFICDTDGLTVEQEELLDLLSNAQKNGAQDVKLFSVRNGKTMQIELNTEEHEIANEEME